MTNKALMERIQEFRSKPENQSPHGRFLGLDILDIDDAKALVEIPYNPSLAGNASTGILHGGVITTVLDAACGIAVIAAMEHQVPIATLDLRIDYLKPATPELPVRAAAHCYKLTKNVCFVQGQAYHEDAEDPIANCSATFMITQAEASSASSPKFDNTRDKQS